MEILNPEGIEILSPLSLFILFVGKSMRTFGGL